MITASHNARAITGFKLKASYGGSALQEQCRRVEVYLNDNEQRARGPNLMDYEQARSQGLIQRFNPLPSYYEQLRKLINFRCHRRKPAAPGGGFNVWLRTGCDQRHLARYGL
jgi:phosphomannomutase